MGYPHALTRVEGRVAIRNGAWVVTAAGAASYSNQNLFAVRTNVTNAEKTIFKKIIDGEIPADIVYQDEHCLAFNDIAPQAPIHVLVIPKKEIEHLDAISAEDAFLAAHLFTAIQKVTRDLGVNHSYRLISNCGAAAGQTVPHLHFHILAGRDLQWPPG